MKTLLLAAVLAVLAVLAVPAAAAPKGKNAQLKDAALQAVAACREAAEDARASACPPARKAVMDALKRLPNDKEVAGATLDLSEAGYFPLSEKAKKRLAATAKR